MYQTKIANQLSKLNELLKIVPEEKEEVSKYEKLYSRLTVEIQNSGITPDDMDRIYQGLYKHLKDVKQRVVGKDKIQKRSFDSFLEHHKANQKKILPLIEEINFSPDNLKSPSSVTIEDLSKLDFDMLGHTEEQLVGFSVDIFKYLNIHPELNIKEHALKGLVYEIACGYNVLPYHNFTHAFSVFQMFFSLVRKTNIKDYIGNMEIFAGLLASLIHDMNHRGVNNAWHSKKRSYESQLYSDTSVMESGHISSFFAVLRRRPDLAIVDSISDPNTRTFFKRLLVTNVLATDMVKHSRQITKFTKRGRATLEYKDLQKKGLEADANVKDLALLADRAEDKRFISNVIVHACDIGNCALPFEKYIQWAGLVVQEFESQTIKEAKHGLDVTGFLKFKDNKAFYDGQNFFIKNIVSPLWVSMSSVFTGLEDFMQNMDDNMKRLKEEKEKLA